MTCRDVRELADSFLGEELLTESMHDILRHLDSCPSCRADIDARRRLRTALRDAFARAPELQPSVGFGDRLRSHLRETTVRERRSWMHSTGWLALAAGVLLASGLTVAVLLNRSSLDGSVSSSDALAQDAIGDHQNCALKFRLVRTPIPLEDAAERFDGAFRLLLSAPPDNISTPQGPAHVVERHSCAYDARRFGHVVIQYRGRVVSLLMTTSDGARRLADSDVAIPHVIGRPMNGLSVVAVNGPRHAILLVSDLDPAALTELSRAISMPLARQLEVSGVRPSTTIARLLPALGPVSGPRALANAPGIARRER